MSQPIAVRLPEPLWERLDTLARTTRRPKALYIREALEKQIDQIEWEEGILQRREDIRAGRVKAVPEAEARKILGLES